ncbi:hypothetical protein VTJ49DRAFT_2752 [Mycothermus thermophilus]|uniref:Uncharacterized protein n=1 Tax=Humicola insolens TaxID=85995 RepID=A0ABR3VN08_HUMIN
MTGPIERQDYGGTGPLGSLTLVFTPPCPTSWLLTTTRLFSQYPPFPTTGPTSCDPPAWRANIAEAGFRYYSPAVCPHDFEVGPSCRITKTRTSEGFPAVQPGETAVYCVPKGLTCTTDITDWRGGVWGFATRDVFVTVGPAIQIRWAEADLTALETHPLTPGLKLAETIAGAVSETNMAMPTTEGPIPTHTTPEPTTLIVASTTVRVTDETFSLIHETARPTTELAPASTAGTNGNSGIGSLSRTTGIIVIVLVTFAAGVIIWTAAFLVARRYKKRLENQKKPGDLLIEPNKPWLGQNSWLRSPSLQPPWYSPRSVLSSNSRMIRESFGEKINDPAAALSRLKIPKPLSLSSPRSASPSARSFRWRLPRSPRKCESDTCASATGISGASTPSPAARAAMDHTGAWQPRLDRRQSWDRQEYKHAMLAQQQLFAAVSPAGRKEGEANGEVKGDIGIAGFSEA